MEYSPLNMAHHYSRKATYHIKANRYNEAIACHQQAIDCLDQAISNTKVTRTVESLKLQRDFHLKYKQAIIMKKKHFRKYVRIIDRLRKNKKDDEAAVLGKSACEIEISIYKIIDESDVLMDKLIEDCGDGDEISCSSRSSSNNNVGCSSSSSISSINSSGITKNINSRISQESLTSSAPETPKPTGVVVEELRLLNYKMYVLVRELMTKLDAYIANSDDLREEIKLLEGYVGKPGEIRIPTEQELKYIRTEMFSQKDNDDDDEDDDDDYNDDVEDDDDNNGEQRDSDYMKNKYSPEFMAQFHNVVNLMASNVNLHKDDDPELIDRGSNIDLNVNFNKF